MAAYELFCPQGSNPLGAVKIHNPRCAKVEFDRSVRSNILVLDGDIQQSRLQIPREDRPLSSLQLSFTLLCLQIYVPASGQCSIEATVSHNSMVRMKLSASTFVTKADMVDARGTPHIKLPLAVPRNVWVQVVLHLPGIVSHLFGLPAVKWLDAVVVAGSVRIRKLFSCHDEATALDKPGGVLLFTVPAFSPPVWQSAAPLVSSDDKKDVKAAASKPGASPAKPSHFAGDGGSRAPHGVPPPASCATKPAFGPAEAPPSPFQLRFQRAEDGSVTFSVDAPGKTPAVPDCEGVEADSGPMEPSDPLPLPAPLPPEAISYRRLVSPAQPPPACARVSGPRTDAGARGGCATPPETAESPVVPTSSEFGGTAYFSLLDRESTDDRLVAAVAGHLAGWTEAGSLETFPSGVKSAAPAAPKAQPAWNANVNSRARVLAKPIAKVDDRPPTPAVDESIALLQLRAVAELPSDEALAYTPPAEEKTHCDASLPPHLRFHRVVGYGVGNLDVERTKKDSDTEGTEDTECDSDDERKGGGRRAGVAPRGKVAAGAARPPMR